MWVKIRYKNLILQACVIRCSVGIACAWAVVPCVAKIWEPNIGANIFHTWRSIWVGIFPLGQVAGCAQVDQMELDKIWVHMFLAP